ncbi:MAG: (deoxy)nucleoside triphosphate pyrophosphohydrolase [Roseburia sp.]|nr:(deoxy)nucleoside triphosphate pyrophosphohydrolase [Anaeroplasma bactoclasticum]MCM1196044.1 (deoxy)nucleoside triphosphate pyrophosphohydrolase [Roseburia sp.]
MKHIEVVCAFIFNNKKEIFCCKRGTGRALEGFWEFPGGKIERNEFKEKAIVREIKEELKATILPIKYVGSVYHEYKLLQVPFSITMYGYLCELIDGELTLTEHTNYMWLKAEELSNVAFAAADKPFIDMLKDL